jgi:hypothetical protein
MGGAAYRDLSGLINDEVTAHVYRLFSKNFLVFVDVLSYISQKSNIQSDESILRLYDRYLKTGSEIARQKLHEMGINTMAPEQNKKLKQF